MRRQRQGMGRRHLRGGQGNEVFRPRAWLRAAVGAATLFWAGMLVLLACLGGATEQGWLGSVFFVALFVGLGRFYGSLVIEVAGDRLIMRGPWLRQVVDFAEVERVDVLPGVLQTTYRVAVRARTVQFTSLFADHRRLADIIVERAHLAPLRR